MVQARQPCRQLAAGTHNSGTVQCIWDDMEAGTKLIATGSHLTASAAFAIYQYAPVGIGYQYRAWTLVYTFSRYTTLSGPIAARTRQ